MNLTQRRPAAGGCGSCGLSPDPTMSRLSPFVGRYQWT